MEANEDTSTSLVVSEDDFLLLVQMFGHALEKSEVDIERLAVMPELQQAARERMQGYRRLHGELTGLVCKGDVTITPVLKGDEYDGE